MNIMGRWYWDYRPEGAPVFVCADGPKPKFFAFLDAADEALAHYMKAVNQLANVELAQDDLRRAEEFHQKIQATDWDPVGSTNNPARMSLALQEKRDSSRRIEQAQIRLDDAIKLRERLQSGEFTAGAWRTKWLAES